MDLFDQLHYQDAIPTLRNAKEVMHRLALANQKSDVDVAIEADQTEQNEVEGAVAGADDSDD